MSKDTVTYIAEHETEYVTVSFDIGLFPHVTVSFDIGLFSHVTVSFGIGLFSYVTVSFDILCDTLWCLRRFSACIRTCQRIRVTRVSWRIHMSQIPMYDMTHPYVTWMIHTWHDSGASRRVSARVSAWRAHTFRYVKYVQRALCMWKIDLWKKLSAETYRQHTTTHCDALRRTATHCNALQRTATHCNTLQHTARLCKTPQHTAKRCKTLQHTATHCNTLQHLATRTATHCNTLQHTATHCNTLQHTATHCNTLQHTATHYNTLQHTATHCNTLQRTAKHTAAHCKAPQHTATHCNTLQHTATYCEILPHIATHCNTRDLLAPSVCACVSVWHVHTLRQGTQSCHICTRHVMHEWGMSHVRSWGMYHRWMSHVMVTWRTPTLMARHWVMSHMNEACRTCMYDMPYEMTYHINMNESCHTWISHVTYEALSRVSYMNDSYHIHMARTHSEKVHAQTKNARISEETYKFSNMCFFGGKTNARIWKETIQRDLLTCDHHAYVQKDLCIWKETVVHKLRRIYGKNVYIRQRDVYIWK